jgi:hypothetical protein
LRKSARNWGPVGHTEIVDCGKAQDPVHGGHAGEALCCHCRKQGRSPGALPFGFCKNWEQELVRLKIISFQLDHEFSLDHTLGI